jgi:putative hydrolase of the HAD superfamily
VLLWTIRKINSTNPDANAWAQYERNDVDAAGFCELFEAEASVLGFDIAGQEVLDCLKTEIRPFMVDAVRKIRANFRTAMLTNNFSAGDDPGSGSHGEAKQLFEVIIESSKAGVRKPTPRFYELACEALDVEPAACVFLDDLGINLKPARAMGMTTIKVVDPHVALAELSEILELDLA